MKVIRFQFLFFLIFHLGFSQDYIEITKPSINIRMEPSTSSVIIGSALSGEIYLTNGSNDKWYSVLLPSGETRWIYKRLVRTVDLKRPALDSLDILIIQKDLENNIERATADSYETPIQQLNQIQIKNVLFDRYMLLTLQYYSLNPVDYEYIMNYTHPSIRGVLQPVAEHLVSVSHVDYDLFKIDDVNMYIETKRCFKIGSVIDAMIFIYYADDNYVQQLCFENGYGNGFENCYNIKNFYESVIEEPNLVVLTKEGKIKQTNLVLRPATLKLHK